MKGGDGMSFDVPRWLWILVLILIVLLVLQVTGLLNVHFNISH
jgi:hypothetical protein